jgi:uncharacterized membrane protein
MKSSSFNPPIKPATIFNNLIGFSFLKSEIDRLLVYSAFFSVGLVVMRIWYTRELTFMFMPWNLFLAVVPYCLLKFFSLKFMSNPFTFLLLFVVWLLFIPNTFYMITDLFHLFKRDNIPQWFDLILLMSFAWNGLVLGTLSIRQMEKLLAIRLPRLPGGVFIAAMMFLNAFGVYLGRYLRFNSWDVISNPFILFMDIAGLILQPFEYKGAWAMILSFTIMMMIMYQMLKKLSRQLG